MLRPTSRRVKAANRSAFRRAVSRAFYSRFTATLIAMLIIAIATACGTDTAVAPDSTDSPVYAGMLIAVLVFAVVFMGAMALTRLVTRAIEFLAGLLSHLIKVAIAAGVGGVVVLVVMVATAAA